MVVRIPPICVLSEMLCICVFLSHCAFVCRALDMQLFLDVLQIAGDQCFHNTSVISTDFRSELQGPHHSWNITLYIHKQIHLIKRTTLAARMVAPASINVQTYETYKYQNGKHSPIRWCVIIKVNRRTRAHAPSSHMRRLPQASSASALVLTKRHRIYRIIYLRLCFFFSVQYSLHRHHHQHMVNN